MTTTLKRVALQVLAVAAVAACGDARANDADQADLKRDLEMASAATMKLATPTVDSALLSAMETKPQNAPQPKKVVKRGAGPRAVASNAPTVQAEPELDVADVGESTTTESVAVAPAPEPINEPVAVAPRPQPPVIFTGGTGDYGTGSGGMGGGRGGVVIRGGGVDGDNCDLHRGRGTRGGIYTRGPVWVPQVISQTPQTRGTSAGGVSRSAPRSGASSRATTVSRPTTSRPSGRTGLR